MCRLFGIIANKEVDIEFSFNLANKPFRELSYKHPDGWGIGYYIKGKAEIFKQGLDEVGNLKEYNFSIVKNIRSKIIISHVRKATYGNKSSINAHPFFFKNWIFAHNGSVNKECLLKHLEKNYEIEIKGETDSEVYFLLLIQEIEKLKNPVEGIKNALEIIYKCGNYTGLNFILSDGNVLYAYRNASSNESYYSLYFLKREPTLSKPFEHLSENTRQMLKSKLLLEEKAVLVCSEKLTEERWKEIPLKTLLIVSPDLAVKKEKL